LEAGQVLLRHVAKQIRHHVCRIAGRPEVLVGFDDVDHSGMSLSRERTAASNKGMKQTKPAQAMELRSLSPVLGGPDPAGGRASFAS
jgi:hypothetical protein